MKTQGSVRQKNSYLYTFWRENRKPDPLLEAQLQGNTYAALLTNPLRVDKPLGLCYPLHWFGNVFEESRRQMADLSFI
jgi:hypothetical protein